VKMRQMGLIALSESGRALPRFETQRRYSGPQVVVAFLAAPRKSRLNSFVTDGIARNEQTAIGIIHQIGALGTGPPAVKRTLSAVAYDDQIGSNLLGKLSDPSAGWPLINLATGSNPRFFSLATPSLSISLKLSSI